MYVIRLTKGFPHGVSSDGEMGVEMRFCGSGKWLLKRDTDFQGEDFNGRSRLGSQQCERVAHELGEYHPPGSVVLRAYSKAHSGGHVLVDCGK